MLQDEDEGDFMFVDVVENDRLLMYELKLT